MTFENLRPPPKPLAAVDDRHIITLGTEPDGRCEAPKATADHDCPAHARKGLPSTAHARWSAMPAIKAPESEGSEPASRDA